MLITSQLEKVGINTIGYSRAQNHYNALKKKMIQSIKNNEQMQSARSKAIKSFNEDIEKTIVQDMDTNDRMTEKAEALLKELETSVVKWLDDNQNIPAELQSLLKKIQDSGRNNDKRIKKSADERLLDRIKKHQKEILALMPLDAVIQDISLPQENGADISDITNQITSYYTRLIYTSVMSNSDLNIHRQNYVQSLKGYYTEISEYEVLSKYFEGLINTFHSGSKKVNNVDTELDLVFSELNDLEDIMSKNVSIIARIEGLTSKDQFRTLEEIQNSINWFGEQSKSWQLKTNKWSYSIGHRKNLLSSFLTEPNASKYGSLQGIAFLARQKNILLSLGATNVLINTGGKRQWMDQFIKDFREANYLLAFSGGGKNPLSSHIVLTKLYNKNIPVI